MLFRQDAPYPSLRDNNGADFPVPDLIHFARTYTPNEADWRNGEAWPTFLSDEEVALMPPTALHTNDLDTLRDEGIEFGKRLAAAGKSRYVDLRTPRVSGWDERGP